MSYIHNGIHYEEVDEVGENCYGDRTLVSAACDRFFTGRGLKPEVTWNRPFVIQYKPRKSGKRLVRAATVLLLLANHCTGQTVEIHTQTKVVRIGRTHQQAVIYAGTLAVWRAFDASNKGVVR